MNETYRRYAALLFSIALGVLREDAAAEDCVHDTIVRLWERPDSYRPERGALRPFLVVAVRNEALTARRTALRRLAKLPKLYDARTPADPAEIVASPRLTEYVNRLPEPQRDAIVLAYVRGWTHREIADELSLPLGTVKSRLHLALRQLARALGTGPA